MQFVSFQPLDWKTCDRYRIDETKRLGFPPMYCSLAETEMMAAINVCLSYPSVPEKVVFFRTHDWYLIPKFFQEAYVGGFTDGRHIGYLSRKEGMTRYKPETGTFDDLLREGMPYENEFLVDPKSVEPVAEIDVKSSVCDFAKKSDDYNNFLKQSDIYLKNGRSAIMEQKRKGQFSWRTEDELIRMADASWWCNVYITNDLFIRDYRRVFGTSRLDDGIRSMHGCFDSGFRKYYDAFTEYPSKKTLHKCILYLEKKFGK